MNNSIDISVGKTTDIQIFGISSSLYDYRLCYFINKNLALDLHKESDIPVYFNNLKKTYFFSYFHQLYNDNNGIFLIKNYNKKQCIIKEYKPADYMLVVNGLYFLEAYPDLMSNLSKINNIQLVFKMDKLKEKTIDYLQMDLKLHINDLQTAELNKIKELEKQQYKKHLPLKKIDL